MLVEEYDVAIVTVRLGTRPRQGGVGSSDDAKRLRKTHTARESEGERCREDEEVVHGPVANLQNLNGATTPAHSKS